MRRNVGQMMNITNTQEAMAKNMVYSGVWHSTVLMCVLVDDGDLGTRPVSVS